MTDSIDHIQMHREIKERQRKGEALEILANVQHEIWSHWMKYLFSVSSQNISGSVTIPANLVARWTRQMNTPYAELSEKEKESEKTYNNIREKDIAKHLSGL